jgi:hypothetical protein
MNLIVALAYAFAAGVSLGMAAFTEGRDRWLYLGQLFVLGALAVLRARRIRDRRQRALTRRFDLG